MSRRGVDGVDERVDPREIDRPVDPVQVVLGELELGEQELREVRGTGGRDLEPYREPELALRELALERLPQVLDFLLVEPQVGIARHAELRVGDDLASLEELVRVLVDDAREQHECVRRAGHVGGQCDDPGQEARRLQDGDARFASERIPARQLDHEVEALVDHQRKGMRGIEPDGREQRLDLAPEVVLHPGALVRAEVAAAQQPDSRGRERRQDPVVQHPILLCDQRMRAVGHGVQQRAQPRDAHPRRRETGEQLLLEAGHADLEELVEVVADDAEETQPLEERNGRILRECQHAPVERKLRQFAIDRCRTGGFHGAADRRGCGRCLGRIEKHARQL